MFNVFTSSSKSILLIDDIILGYADAGAGILDPLGNISLLGGAGDRLWREKCEAANDAEGRMRA